MSENLKLAVEITMVNGQFKAEIINSEKLTQQLGKTGQKSFGALGEAASRADGPLGRFMNRMSSIASFGSATAIVIYAGVTAFTAWAAAVVRGTNIAAAHERQQLRMQAQIRATGGAAGKTAADIDAMADSLARRTLFTDDQIREAQGKLLTFTNVTGAAFDRTIEIAADLAEVMGSDLTSAVTLLGKAVDDPIEGLSALKRAHIQLSPEQEKMIQNLAETGRKGEALNAVLDAVSEKIGPSATAAADGYAGAMHRLADSWDEFLEALEETSTMQYWISAFDTLLQKSRQLIAPTEGEQAGDLFKERYRLEKQNKFFGEGHPNFTANTGRMAEIDAELAALRDARNTRLAAESAPLAGRKKPAATVSLSEQELKAIEDLAKAEAERRENADETIRSAEVRLGLLREEQSLGRQMTDSERDLYLLRTGAYDDLLPSEREQLRLVLETTAALERQTEVTVELAEKSLTFTDGLVQGLDDYLQYATDAYGQALNLADTFFGSLEDTITQALDTGKFKWQDFANSVIHEINRIAARALVAGLTQELIGLAVAGAGFGPGLSAPIGHTGGVIGGDALPKRTVPAYTFAGAARFHGGGMLGADEVPFIGKKGEGVFTPAQMKAMGGAGGGTLVQVINQTGAPVREERGKMPDGRELVKIIIGELGRDMGENGDFTRNLSRTFGLSRRPVTR